MKLVEAVAIGFKHDLKDFFEKKDILLNKVKLPTAAELRGIPIK